MKEGALSKELGQVLDDYEQGHDVREPLELCVDLAVSLESELTLHRLGDVDRAARMAVEGTAEEILENDTVVQVDFKAGKEVQNGRGI